MKKLIFLIGLIGFVGLKAQEVIDVYSEYDHSAIMFHTDTVVNRTDTIVKADKILYLSIGNAPGNTNNIQYKGEEGVWQVLNSTTWINFGDRINPIDSFYVKSVATTDTVYLVKQKKR